MKPQRIQLKRTKGWRMPPNTAKVTRPGVFGNPFVVTDHLGSSRAVKWFRECLERALRGQPYPAAPDGGSLSEEVMMAFDRMAEVVRRLKGKNLACWCKPGDPCHADVLLELANREDA